MTDVISAGDITKFTLTFKDTTGAVIPLQTMTAIKFNFLGPYGAVVEKTPAHVSDGSNGQETWTSAATDFTNALAGDWVLEGYYTDGVTVKRSITDYKFKVRATIT